MTRVSTINLLHSSEKRSPLLEPKSEIPRSRKAIDLSMKKRAITLSMPKRAIDLSMKKRAIALSIDKSDSQK
ncbi:hypothetical protein [Microcoleus sp. K4-B3]|uniref:hypothetical protein n=1 Tax=Microcoleus sp. K4-B3 TaxID=2818791 RepID=UPI002FD2D642